MTTWRALISPSKDVSLLESRQTKHLKTITQSTNISQQKPTTRYSLDQGFILDDLNIVDDSTISEIKQILIENQQSMLLLQKEIDQHDYNQRQILALQKQIISQRSKYNLKINAQINTCQKKMQEIQVKLQGKK